MSVTTMLRATKKQDNWMTPAYAVRPLLPYLKPDSRILCPFDKTNSAFAEVLSDDHYVFTSHIDDGADFFFYTAKDCRDAGYNYIISNPPYSIKDQVFEHLFKLGKPFAMLMGVTAGLFEGRQFTLFKNMKVETMWLKPRVAYIDEYGITQKSPPFQSCYVCHKVLPKAHMFVELEKE